MTKTFATRTAPLALAALLTGAMLLATNTLAGHQYRVASTRVEQAQAMAMVAPHATVAGHRHAHA